MDKATRSEVAQTLRVAAGILKASDDERLFAILKKVAKKTKIGEYDPVEVVEALKLVDPAWSITEIVIAQPMGGYGDIADIADEMLTKIADDQRVYARGGNGKNEPFRVSFLGKSSEKDTPESLEPIAEKIRKHLHLIPGKKAPKTMEKPEPGKLYAWKVEVVKSDYAGSTSYFIGVFNLMLGIRAWRIQAPDGATLNLPVVPTKRDPEPRILKSPTLFTWLYKSTDAAAKTAERVNTPDFLEQETKRKQRAAIGDKAGTIGSCPFCERHQKLNPKRAHSGHPSMVLHGYQRPGVGYAIGKCFGVGYPPYELSPAGCEAAVEALEKMITRQKEIVASAKTATTFVRFVTISPFQGSYRGDSTFRSMKLGLDGTLAPTDDKVLNREQMRQVERMAGTRAVVVEGTDDVADPASVKEAATKIHDAVVSDAEQALAFMKDDLKRMQAKVKGWKLQPLPGTEA